MTENLKDIYNDVKSWLIYGETKNGILLGILLTFIGTFLKEKELILKELVHKNIYYVILLGTLSATIIIFLSFIPFFLLLFSSKKNPTMDNLIFYKNLSFFKTIVDLEIAYKTQLKQGTQLENIEKYYIQQIYFTSKIAYNKFRAFLLAMILLGVTLIGVIVTMILNIK